MVVAVLLFAMQDTSQHQREVLFQQKLKLCTVVFDMTDPMENSRWVIAPAFGLGLGFGSWGPGKRIASSPRGMEDGAV